MSDIEQEETTEQPTASEDDQALETQGQPVTATEEPSNGVPQKFLEASKIDVIRSYQELERERGRIANEVGELRKSQEEMTEKYRQLEAQRFQPPTSQQSHVQQSQPQQDVDPLSVFEEKFDEDPKAAIRAMAELQQRQLEDQLLRQKMEQEAGKASDFYFQQKQDNPDFARREPVMQQIAQQYSHIIKPEFLNSADAIRILDLASKGQDIDYYQKAAVADTTKHRAEVVDEKRRAQSEASNSEGDSGVDFDSMSNDEYLKHMAGLYGHSSKD